MEFSPNNQIVRLCLQAMAMEEQSHIEEAGKIFLQAWNEASDDFEKFLTAHFVARQQRNLSDKLQWQEKSLQFALIINDETVKSAYYTLYSNVAQSHEALGNFDDAKKYQELAISFKDKLFDHGPFYHGTKASLQVGDLLTPGGKSNYQPDIIMNHIYFTAIVNGAGLAASLAKGDGPKHVYIVEPTDSFENDPNVTDKKFPGNLTRSYRTATPLKIIGEVTDWAKQTPEQLQKWRERLANSKGDIIN
jgi:rifampin ADP-ribosylating transferase